VVGLRRAVRWWRRRKGSVRVVAILATYNEERFIAGCLEHLFEQGVDAYLIDNCSTDRTVKIAERYRQKGLIGIETFPRAEGVYKWQGILERKEQLAATLEADWFMHMDPDEIRLPPSSNRTLAQAFSEVEAQGYNAVNFLEFTFVPTQEEPDHDHPRFQQTMRWYYPFARTFPQQLKAWKRQPEKVELAHSGGHRVRFPGRRMYPESFKMRHYIFLSMQHALSKWVDREYDAAEVQRGWHRLRAALTPETIRLPSQKELRYYTSDEELDPSNPRTRHVWAPPQEERKSD
jgi:glycosyltransferase involved in cell wall biosynthesis